MQMLLEQMYLLVILEILTLIFHIISYYYFVSIFIYCHDKVIYKIAYIGLKATYVLNSFCIALHIASNGEKLKEALSSKSSLLAYFNICLLNFFIFTTKVKFIHFQRHNQAIVGFSTY